MNLDINVILTGLAAPVAVLLVKALLDFSLSHHLVKWLSIIPARSFFRDNPLQLKGRWTQYWGGAGSPNFEQALDRHGHTEIKQFGRYCYAEFVAKNRAYRMFGQIKGGYLIGEWYDESDKAAYFGVFELRIVSGARLEGKYLGHSARTGAVQQDDWIWEKVNS